MQITSSRIAKLRQSSEVSRLKAKVAREVAHHHRPTEEGLYLRPHAESLFVPADGEARGTVLLYHGYTGGPWQYPELAGKLHQAGFHVYAPRMPGHGLMKPNGKPTPKMIPTLGKERLWKDFAQETFEDAAGLGVPVHTVGLSGGANVALAAARQNPGKVETVTAVAPFLGGNGAAGFLLPVLNIFHMVTFGLAGQMLDRIPRKRRPDAPETPRTQGTLGQALAMYRLGLKSREIDAPLQVVTTAGDALSGTSKVKKLLRKNENNPHDKHWYHFPQSSAVPHAMISTVENPNTASVNLLHNLIEGFVEGAQPQGRVE